MSISQTHLESLRMSFTGASYRDLNHEPYRILGFDTYDFPGKSGGLAVVVRVECPSFSDKTTIEWRRFSLTGHELLAPGEYEQEAARIRATPSEANPRKAG